MGDFVRILTEPKSSLVKQYTALLETEGVKLEFTPQGETTFEGRRYAFFVKAAADSGLEETAPIL